MLFVIVGVWFNCKTNTSQILVFSNNIFYASKIYQFNRLLSAEMELSAHLSANK